MNPASTVRSQGKTMAGKGHVKRINPLTSLSAATDVEKSRYKSCLNLYQVDGQMLANGVSERVMIQHQPPAKTKQHDVKQGVFLGDLEIAVGSY